MSFLADLTYAGALNVFPRYYNVRTHSAPPRAPTPRSKPCTGDYCVRVQIPLTSDGRGHVANAVGEGGDWDVLPRTQQYCERHAKLDYKCGKPSVTVKHNESCVDRLFIEWKTSPAINP